MGKNAFEETDKRDGKVTAIVHVRVAADGKTMSFVVDDKQRGATTRYVAEKQ
jgi:hypothetical protein